jgi:siroheme synthase
LVGAGPGDPDLLIKGAKALAEAKCGFVWRPSKWRITKYMPKKKAIKYSLEKKILTNASGH